MSISNFTNIRRRGKAASEAPVSEPEFSEKPIDSTKGFFQGFLNSAKLSFALFAIFFFFYFNISMMEWGFSSPVIIDSSCMAARKQYPFCASGNLSRFPTDFTNNCEFDLYLDKAYLPGKTFLECIREGDIREWNKDVFALQRRVFELQNPRDCSTPEGFALDGKKKRKRWHLVKFSSFGHGSNLFFMIWQIGNHWDRGIPVMISTSIYRFSDIHCGRGWSCHLSPLSNQSGCVLDKQGLNLTSVINYSERISREVITMDKWCKPHGVFVVEMGRCICDSGFYPSNKYDVTGCAPSNHYMFKDGKKWRPRKKIYDDNKIAYLTSLEEHWIDSAPGEVFTKRNAIKGDPSSGPLPDENDERRYDEDNIDVTPSLKLKYGWFWWWSQINWILHENSPLRRRSLDQLEKEVGLIPKVPCIAVHVRRGNTCNDETAKHRTCPKISVYLEAVRNLSKLYGPFTQIYIASDDENAIEEAQQLGLEFEWKFQKFDRKKYSKFYIDENTLINEPATLNELYVDIFGMAKCDALVGSMSSRLLWIVYGIMIGEKGYYPPFISIDFVSEF